MTIERVHAHHVRLTTRPSYRGGISPACGEEGRQRSGKNHCCIAGGLMSVGSGSGGAILSCVILPDTNPRKETERRTRRDPAPPRSRLTCSSTCSGGYRHELELEI
eukprot:5484013-Prymnesium_polylepis.1